MASSTWVATTLYPLLGLHLASSLSNCTPQLWTFASLCIQRRDWAASRPWCSTVFQSCSRSLKQERGNWTLPPKDCRTQSLPRIHPQCESWSAPSPKSKDFGSSSANFPLDDSWPWCPKGPSIWSCSIAKSRRNRQRLWCWTASESITRWGLQGKLDLRRPLSLKGPGNPNAWHWTKPPNLRRPLSLIGPAPPNPWHWTKPPNRPRPVFLVGRGDPTSLLLPNSASRPKFGCSPGSDSPTRCSPWGRPGFLWCWCLPGWATPRHGAHGTPWPRNRGDHGRGVWSLWRRIHSWAGQKDGWREAPHRRGRLFVVECFLALRNPQLLAVSKTGPRTSGKFPGSTRRLVSLGLVSCCCFFPMDDLIR